MQLSFFIFTFLLSSTLHAKFIPAILTYSNGTTRTGFAELIDDGYIEKVKFRAMEKGDTEKIYCEELSKIEYTDDNGNKYIAMYLSQKTTKNKYVKVWAYLIYDGELSVFTNRSFSVAVPNAIGSLSPTYQTNYFLKFKGDDFVEFVYFSTGMTTEIGFNTMLKKRATKIFKDRCPKLSSAIESKELDPKKNVFNIVEYYESNCK